MGSQSKNIKVILGTMTIGKEGCEGIRVSSQEDTLALLDVFQKYGHVEIDTARVYGNGSTEEYLVAIDYEKRGLEMATKLYPTAGKGMEWMCEEVYTHSPADLRRGLLKSLETLNAKKVSIFFLHGPDRTTPFEDTLREINRLHQEGLFEKFGMSNYQSWEIARICEICKQNDWIMPSVVQGLYNAHHRVVESELIPCLRHYGLSFYIFNPLAGGFLTSRYRRDQAEVGMGERFDPNQKHGQLHRNRYWTDANFDALEILRPVIAKHGISESEAALRWLSHHSALKKELGDGVVVGASSAHHLKDNLEALGKGPLPDDVVQALDAGWERTRSLPLRYWH